jgi:low temperature requirement protein LtrA
VKSLRYFDPQRRATWLELFFDLIIVVALFIGLAMICYVLLNMRYRHLVPAAHAG